MTARALVAAEPSWGRAPVPAALPGAAQTGDSLPWTAVDTCTGTGPRGFARFKDVEPGRGDASVLQGFALAGHPVSHGGLVPSWEGTAGSSSEGPPDVMADVPAGGLSLGLR